MKTVPATIKDMPCIYFFRSPPFKMPNSNIPYIIEVFSDASLNYGAWINRDGSQKTFAIPEGFQCSTLASEFYAAEQAIRDAVPLGNIIHIYCDNLHVCQILRDRRIAHPVRQALIAEHLDSLISFVDENNIQLSVLHIPTNLNPADPISGCPKINSDRLRADERLRSDVLQPALL